MQVGSATDIYGDSSGAAKQQVKSLDKDAFLQLFVEQLKNQDPTAPQDASTMINQMAMFSILEQLTNINTDIEQIKLSQQVGDASALLGKQVKVQAKDGEISGVVEKVTLVDQEVQVFINGNGYDLSEITEVR